MGFGKLLYLDMEEIPAKLGYFVVDCFDCNNMKMLVGNHKVKVDSKAINRLLGIPKEGLNLILIRRVRKLNGYVATWRDLYQSDFVVASEIVARIMSSKDEKGGEDNQNNGQKQKSDSEQEQIRTGNEAKSDIL
ncbi:hypothetical protein R6Q57_000471 [Mikania cordata]